MTHTEAVALLDAWCLLHERYTTEHPEGEVAYYQKTRPFHEVTFDAKNLAAFLTYVLEQRHGAQPR